MSVKNLLSALAVAAARLADTRLLLVASLMSIVAFEANAQQCVAETGLRPVMAATAQCLPGADAITSMQERFDRHVSNIKLDAFGELQSVNLNGREFKVLDGKNFSAFVVDGKRYQLETVRESPNQASALVLTEQGSNDVVALFDTEANPYLKVILAGHDIDRLPSSSMGFAAIQQTLAAKTTTAENSALSKIIASGRAKKVCANETDCDAGRDLDYARCDAMMDEATAWAVLAVGGGTGIGALGGIPGAAVGAGVGATLAAAIIYDAAQRKFGCKAAAIGNWAVCKMSC